MIPTLAPLYFVTGNPFPIELRELEHSIYRLLIDLCRLLIFLTKCPQDLEIAGELANVQ